MSVASIPSALAIGFTFPILGAAFVALRFYTRWHQKAERKVDDWLCVPALLCLTGCCASLLTGVFGNAFDGEEISDPSSVTEPQRLLAQTTGPLVLFYIVGNALVKMSILFFYRRIFIGRVFSICTWIVMGCTFVWLIYAIIAWLLYCGTNIQVNFEGCWAICPLWGFEIQIPVYVVNCVIDLLVLILPIPVVWRLQLKLSRKILVTLVFLLGGLAFVASILNTIIQLVYLLQPDTIINAESESISFFQGPTLFYAWPPVELGIGLIACNLPTLSSPAANSVPQHLRHWWSLSFARLSSRSSSSPKPGSDPDSNSGAREKHRTDQTDRSLSATVHAPGKRRSLSDSATAIESRDHEQGIRQHSEKSITSESGRRLVRDRTHDSDTAEFIPRAEYFLGGRGLEDGDGSSIARESWVGRRWP